MKTEKLKIAIQGISTCFHEVAARTYFNDSIEPVECLTFHKLCESLKKKESDFAMMAIENTIAGSILPNYFLLQEFRFSIVGEIYLPIHLHLLAYPGVKLEEIKTIESHPMAIRQCYDFLHKLNGIELRESDDTAISARKVAEKKLKATAAIANEFESRATHRLAQGGQARHEQPFHNARSGAEPDIERLARATPGEVGQFREMPPGQARKFLARISQRDLLSSPARKPCTEE